MKILVLSQYFWPEPFVINELSLQLKKQGHFVTILTGKPNYPDGDLYPGYKAKGTIKEFYQGIPVYRVPIRPRKKGGALNLILNYLSFLCFGLIYAVKFFRKEKFDVVFIYAPSPITSAIPGIFLKWLTNAHITLWIQDLWPESLQATGFVRNPLILKAVEKLVRTIYFFSDTLLVQSQAFIQPVSRLIKKQSKIIYYPNCSIDLANIPCSNEQLDPNLINTLEKNFCLVFSGNIGTAQSVETILRAAEILISLPEIKIVFVGSGSIKGKLEEQVHLKRLSNVIFAGRFAPEHMPLIYSLASGLVVTLKKDEILTYTIPSKVQGYLAAGRPIIAALNGEAARVIHESGAGLVTPSENSVALAESIEKLYLMPKSLREIMGEAGRKYFLKHYELTQQGLRLEEILEARIRDRNKFI